MKSIRYLLWVDKANIVQKAIKQELPLNMVRSVYFNVVNPIVPVVPVVRICKSIIVSGIRNKIT